MAGLISAALSTALILALLATPLRLLPMSSRILLSLGCIALLAAAQAGILPIKLPDPGRIVSQSVLSKPPFQAGFTFGARMGTGYTTMAPSPVPFMMATIYVLLGAGLLAAIALTTGFAAARASLAVSSVVSDRQEDDILKSWPTARGLLFRTATVAILIATLVAAVS